MKVDSPVRYARARHLGDDRRTTGDVRLADDAAREARADDREVAEQLAAPRSLPAASSSASRAEVPEPQGERSTSPSANTVTFRWVNGARSSSCQKMTP